LALDEHLHLLLPSLLRLVSPAAPGTPLEVRRAVLRGLRRLLPRLQLAGHSSALMQPLMRLLEGPPEELRREALDTICSLALALGPDFAIFAPSLIKVRRGRVCAAERCCVGCTWWWCGHGRMWEVDGQLACGRTLDVLSLGFHGAL
jgi:FKBP12-rapamycin complex-associated protein